jgi:hypothetical protein
LKNEPHLNSANKTFFDTPDRSSREEILQEIIHFKENSIINQVLGGFPDVAVILNKNRQIVAFNSKALNSFVSDDYFEIVGNRFGEVINCIHHSEAEGGCGTSLFCKECGAANSIKKSREAKTATEEECRITTETNGKEISHNFLVYSKPIDIDGTDYTVFAVRDISHEKRREALENIFFHDVLNTASAVKGLAEILPDAESEEERIDLTSALSTSTKQLVSEIMAQRDLRNAEDGHLQPNFEMLSVNDVLVSIHEAYKQHELAENKSLLIEKVDPDFTFDSDSSLLFRCLGNLVKNALEESGINEIVLISAICSGETLNFRVRSEKLIPDNVQLQLFQRSFTTKKKKGRGLGLYSVKLIVEQYLKGNVSFISNKKDRTIFTITLPLNSEL